MLLVQIDEFINNLQLSVDSSSPLKKKRECKKKMECPLFTKKKKAKRRAHAEKNLEMKRLLFLFRKKIVTFYDI